MIAAPSIRGRARRILYISPCWPHGESFGSQVRALHVCRALQKLGDLKLVVADFSRPDPATVARTSAEFDVLAYGSFAAIADVGLSTRVRRFVDPRLLPPDGLVVEESLRAKVLPVLKDFDLVWLHNLRTANAFELWRWPHSVIDIDDVPSTYERSLVQTAGILSQRLKAAARMVAWRRREQRLGERFDSLVVCSQADRAHLPRGVPSFVVPNGFERPAHEPLRLPTTPPRVGFIGRFAYPPNLNGVRWFAAECWPLIKRAVPGARLRLVGRATDGPLKPAGADIDGLGWVADAADEIATWSAMIVPVRTGAGTRVKLAEAFSRKCPVVSTRLGAFGYDVNDGAELRLADSPAAFAETCTRLMEQPEEGAALAERAWARFLQEWTWDAIAPRIWAAAEKSLQRVSA